MPQAAGRAPRRSADTRKQAPRNQVPRRRRRRAANQSRRLQFHYMLRLRHFRYRIAWVMLTILAMAALVPSLSRAAALVQGDTAPWSVVCAAPAAGAAGVDLVAAPVEARHLLEHCPLCMLQADGLGLPPHVRPLVAPVAPGHSVPWLFLQAPRPLHAWSSAQARAPPGSA